VVENYTDLMVFYILKPNREVIICKDVWVIPTNQLLDDSMKEHLADYNAHICFKIGDHLEEIDPILADQEPIPDFLFDDEALDEPEEPEAAAENDDQQSTPEAYDQWLMAKVDRQKRQPSLVTNGIKMVSPSDRNIRIPSWIPENTKLSSQTGRSRPSRRTSLLRLSTGKLTTMGIATLSSRKLSTTT
jgi:hypothetical protein